VQSLVHAELRPGRVRNRTRFSGSPGSSSYRFAAGPLADLPIEHALASPDRKRELARGSRCLAVFAIGYFRQTSEFRGNRQAIHATTTPRLHTPVQTPRGQERGTSALAAVIDARHGIRASERDASWTNHQRRSHAPTPQAVRVTSASRTGHLRDSHAPPPHIAGANSAQGTVDLCAGNFGDGGRLRHAWLRGSRRGRLCRRRGCLAHLVEVGRSFFSPATTRAPTDRWRVWRVSFHTHSLGEVNPAEPGLYVEQQTVCLPLDWLFLSTNVSAWVGPRPIPSVSWLGAWRRVPPA